MTRRAPVVTNVTRKGDGYLFTLAESAESTRSTTFNTFNKKVR